MSKEEGTGEPIYLELVDALELYAAIITGMPAQAAVLAHGIAESQAFIDANKRLALVAKLTFLELNGYRVEALDPDLADWILSFSAGTTPQQLAPLVRDAMRPIP